MKKTTGPATAARISEARLQRLTHQNTKLKMQIAEMEGRLAPVEQIKAEVIRANMTVKTQLLALPFRLSDQMASTADSHECSRILQGAIIQCLNDLAYGREQQPNVCPCCGRKMEEE